jgi:hypothetical protein
MKKFCFIVNFSIWIVIKNYLCDIKTEEKRENVLDLTFLERVKKIEREIIFLPNTPKVYVHYFS